MDTIQERISFLSVEFFDGNLSRMARATFISQATLKDITGEKANNPSYDTICKLLENGRLKLNPDWLLRGKGTMQGGAGTPFYSDLPVSAGQKDLAHFDESVKPLSYLDIPGVSAIAYFPVIGFSMEPEVRAGDCIGIADVNRWDIFDTEKIYLLVTNDDRMIKHLRVDDSSPDFVWCSSPNYKEFKLYKTEIKEIYRVVFVGRVV